MQARQQARRTTRRQQEDNLEIGIIKQYLGNGTEIGRPTVPQ